MPSLPTLRLAIGPLQGETTMLDAADVEWHITNHNEEYCQGGEAAVHIVRWQNRRGVPSSWPIAEGEQVALKVHRRPDGKGGLKEVLTEGEAEEEGECRCCRLTVVTWILHVPACFCAACIVSWIERLRHLSSPIPRAPCLSARLLQRA